MKELTGKVLSIRMNKTVVVAVERQVKHPLYKKIIRRSKKYKVHNQNLTLKEGDLVKIVETIPISKDKHFKVIKKL
ncbi:30S ribosomal protein S17 [Candidatus Gottesmanbacteria bacterium RIFCSPHIGHO2_02_FULL_39_14]|uniref:Small ribosomal subunit protein uS17 n=3 Tax=Candidatus Gottesmaniibacteriota TaxID=1752720 RepID=A0A1F5ZU29_9BACT|nr:MAG: 30S ribosomal protein S17 [Candidatus Gottesmanbacteria bacterium RBG_16_38_7b]OGG15979.1 MAG: 30S ribosomal protein S17 [Candidatus Gottesmanbacteria bacterium RIFCSPHIGHO2_02_FULL_39_14]OGG31121.1 MAG: 30S ribosomal protein S17 [Candidatus Gottesmanbacteria bacterium RIFCSPLOWO2_02_FULL_38_8]